MAAKSFGSAFLVAALLAGAAPADAQPRGGRDGGPPFCRSDAGHPVHGWGWCVAKGWASLVHYGARFRGPAYHPSHAWVVVTWRDAAFRAPRGRAYRAPRVRPHDRWMGHGELRGVMGDVVVRRIAAHGRRMGVDGRLSARWIDGGFGGATLLVRMASTPVAELHDFDLDGLVDRVYLRGY